MRPPGAGSSGRRVVIVLALLSALWLVASPNTPLRNGSREAARAEETPRAAKPKSAQSRKPAPEPVHGIIMSGYSAGGEKFDELVGLIDRTELNAVVIDIKDEGGTVSWIPRDGEAAAIGAGVAKVRDIRAKVKRLHDKKIYVIGRIVCFKDPVLAQVRPDLAIQDTQGGIWRDQKGLGWADPYAPEVWSYQLALAREAVDAGFDEIQFDYVRFPSDGTLSRAWYRHRDGRSSADVIEGFLATAYADLAARGAWVSADLFGLVTLARDDLGIGQRIEAVADHVDYLSLMLYPSHYHKPEYGLRDPEREPYKTISLSLADAKKRIEGSRAKLRPWLQDFTLRVTYTPVEVRAQIKAVEDAGLSEWLLWNANNRYSEDALRPTKKATDAGRRAS